MNVWDEEDYMIGESPAYEWEEPYHYHSCPECYEHHKCNMDCTIEPDLSRDGRPFGSHCECDACYEKIKKAKSKDNKYVKIYSQQWWDIYNGFANPQPYLDEQGNIKNWYSME